MSLKDELLGRTAGREPGFALVMPAGWEQFGPDARSESALLKLASARLRSQHRPDLYGQLQVQVRRAFSGLRAKDGVAIYLQTEAPDELVMPMSITASRVHAADGASLDGQVAALIRDHGATRFAGSGSMIRWEKDAVQSMGAEKAATHTIAYLTPIPGTERRVAIQLTTAIVHPVELDPEDRLVLGFSEISDAIVSTFQWGPA